MGSVENMITQRRNVSLDLIRSVAALFVVLNHVETLRYPIDRGDLSGLATGDQMLCLSGFTLGRIGVPLFLMLSGYLLLPRTYDKMRIRRFYRHNLLPMLLVWEFWILVYTLYCYHLSFDRLQYLREALFLEGAPLSHSWYMPVILGIYLFLPYVAIVLAHMEGRILAGLMAVTYVFAFVLPTILRVAGSYEMVIPEMAAKLDLSYSGGTYGLYLVLGYCMARYQERLRQLFMGTRRLALCAVTALLWGTAVTWEWHAYRNGYHLNIWYDNVLLPLIAVGVFLLLQGVTIPHMADGILARLSGEAFGIYLVHVILLQQYLWRVGVTASAGRDALVMLVIGYLGSWGVVEIASLTRAGRILLVNKAPAAKVRSS